MDSDDREQCCSVLRRIPGTTWQRFFEAKEGSGLARQDAIARETLRFAEHAQTGAPRKPVEAVADLLGDRLLSDTVAGAAIRQMVLASMPRTHWEKAFRRYRAEAGARADAVHGNMVQHGAGTEVMAEYWHQGSTWARSFCELAGLPACLAERRRNVLPEDEDIGSVEPLPPLHDFQLDVYRKLRKVLETGVGTTGMLSLPTGAGKTRVAVEAIVDHLAQDSARRNVVTWVAQSEELQRQAWECFRQVWQTPPKRAKGAIRRPGILRVVRAWGARRADDVVLGAERTVIIAGVQQLQAWVHKAPEFFDELPSGRMAAIVLDEAHHVLNRQRRDVLVALRARAARGWRPLSTSAPVVGLTATPWRTVARENAQLRTYFQQQLLTPRSLGDSPIRDLQRRGILSRVTAKKLQVHDSPEMTSSQRARFLQTHRLPNDYLEALGRYPGRNGVIVEQLLTLPRRSSVLVFACSIEHASILTLSLNRARGGRVAALVTGKTPRSERLDVLEAFRAREIQFLCNVGVLTTGFDAPKVDVVCMTRPTTSAILYEQMVGRGLRGPKNGGTPRCIVLDVQDEGLPDSVMSYARVVHEWRA